MESWSIEVDKEDFHFSAAHFLIFPDGSAERLHGHNYRVYVKVQGRLTRHGLVIDFMRIKPVVREMVAELDEHWLVPGDHPGLSCKAGPDGGIEIRYGERVYIVPRDDVLVLPINNTSAENLAGWFGREFRSRLESRFPDLELYRLSIAVEETPGQRAVYHFEPDATSS